MDTEVPAQASPVFPFKVRDTDLVLRVKLTLENHSGTAVVDIENLVKVDNVAGPLANVSIMRRLERCLEMVVVTPYQVGVSEFINTTIRGRGPAGLVTPTYGPNKSWPEAHSEDVETQLKERMENPLVRAPYERPSITEDAPEEGSKPRHKGFFQVSVS